MIGEPKMAVPGMEQAPKVEEKENDFETLESIARIIQSKKENKSLDIHAALNSFEKAGLVPQRAKEEITRRLNEMEELGANEAVVTKTSENYTLDAITLYKDNVFEISNFGFLKAELFRFVDENLTRQNIEKVEDLDKTAMIFFDINGLKAVNDNALGAHSSGDLYLSKVVDVFNSGRAAEWLRSIGIEYSPARRSGDEFMVALKGNIGFNVKTDFYGIDGERIENESFGEYIMKRFQEDVEAMDVDDVQDFSSPEQKEVYKEKGINTDEWPDDFRFKASMSGGCMTLLDVLREVKDQDFGDKEYEELIVEITGSMFEGADKKMMINKERDKELRRKSDSAKDVLIEMVYRAGRSDEEQIQELNTKIEELVKRDDKVREKVQEMKAALETLKSMGVSEGALVLMSEQINEMEKILG